MGKYCMKCGNALHIDSRFCAKCGTPVGSESVLRQQTDTPPVQQNNTPSVRQTYAPTEQQARTAPNPSPMNLGKQVSVTQLLCMVLAVLLVVQLAAVALYGWPGVLVKDRSAGHTAAAAKVNPASAKTIGNAKKNGVEIVIPAGTFEKTVQVSIDPVDENAVPTDAGASFLSAPVQLTSDGGEHTLGETVAVRMKLPDSINEEDYLTVMGAYYDGAGWEYILPDFEALEKGYLEFGTPHFSIFAPIKLEKEKALERYANTLAVQNITGTPQTRDEQNLYGEVLQYYSDTLDAMGFTDKTAQGVIMQKLAEENVVGAIAADIKNGNIADVTGHAAEHIAKAIMKASDVKKFKDSLPNAAGGAVSGAVAAALELYETGDYAQAYKEFVYAASGFVPGVELGKAAVEATKAGMKMWQNYSIEHAYKAVYLAQSVAPDGSTTLLGEGTQHLGLALAAVQTCYEFSYHFSDDQEKLNTLGNLAKNMANNAVGYFGSAALQTGFAAVSVLDVVLSEVQSDVLELKLENLGGVYQYYNDVEAPRSAKEWRSIFLNILREHSDDPAAAQQRIESEIDSFCDRFWDLGYGEVKEVAAVSGLRYSFDERQWTRDREILTAQYRAQLLTRLHAPLTSARNYLLRQAQEQAQRELEKQLRLMQRELNKTIKVQIIEQPEKDGDYRYEGYLVRFAPLSADVNAKNWTGKMPKGGTLNTAFTLLGHMQSGSPSTLELYPPGGQSPELVVRFKVSHPVTTIYLSGTGAEETEPSYQDDPKGEEQYHWVLVDTILYDGQEAIETKNKGYVGVYDTRGNASPGNYSVSWNYVGETDTYYDPDIIHGEGEGSQAIFSTPPSTIKAGETVSLSLSLSFTENTLSFFDGRVSAVANFDKWDLEPIEGTRNSIDFSTADGKSYFEIYSSVKYSEKNILSVGETITAVAPAGYEAGDRIAIRTLYRSSVSMGTNYVYEWRPIGASTSVGL